MLCTPAYNFEDEGRASVIKSSLLGKHNFTRSSSLRYILKMKEQGHVYDVSLLLIFSCILCLLFSIYLETESEVGHQ